MERSLDMPRGLAIAAIVGWALTFVSDQALPLLAYGDAGAAGAMLFNYAAIGLPLAFFVAFAAAWPLWRILDRRGWRGASAAALCGATCGATTSALQHAAWSTFVWLSAADEQIQASSAHYGYATLHDGAPTLFGFALAAGDVVVNALIGAVVGLIALRFARTPLQPSAASAGLS